MEEIIRGCVGNYTREKSGVKYQYDGRYTVGEEVEWSAVIQRGEHVKGKLSGTIGENKETGVALELTVRDLIESCIEDLVGVAE